jgi:hypothetical protein
VTDGISTVSRKVLRLDGMGYRFTIQRGAALDRTSVALGSTTKASLYGKQCARTIRNWYTASLHSRI